MPKNLNFYQIFTFKCRLFRPFSLFSLELASSIELCWIVENILHFLLSLGFEFRQFFSLKLWIFSIFCKFWLSNVMFFRWFSSLWPWFASSIELCWIVKKILHFFLSFQLEFRHFFKLNLRIFSKFCQFSLSNVMFFRWFPPFRPWFASFNRSVLDYRTNSAFSPVISTRIQGFFSAENCKFSPNFAKIFTFKCGVFPLFFSILPWFRVFNRISLNFRWNCPYSPVVLSRIHVVFSFKNVILFANVSNFSFHRSFFFAIFLHFDFNSNFQSNFVKFKDEILHILLCF